MGNQGMTFLLSCLSACPLYVTTVKNGLKDQLYEAYQKY